MPGTFAARCPHCRTYVPDWCTDEQIGTEVVCKWCEKPFRIERSAGGVGAVGTTVLFGLAGMAIAYLLAMVRFAPAGRGPINVGGGWESAISGLLPPLDGFLLGMLAAGLVLGGLLGLLLVTRRSGVQRSRAAAQAADEVRALKEELRRLKENAPANDPTNRRD